MQSGNYPRQIAKQAKQANCVHYKQILRTVNYVLKTRNGMLKFMPTSEKDKWEFKCMCDSDYAEDKDIRLSVTGHCIYIKKYLIRWKSRA